MRDSYFVYRQKNIELSRLVKSLEMLLLRQKIELLIIDPDIWTGNLSSRGRWFIIRLTNRSIWLFSRSEIYSDAFVNSEYIVLESKINLRSIREKGVKEARVNASEPRPSYPSPLIPFRILRRPRKTSLTSTTTLIASLDSRQATGQVRQPRK